jgi:pimeloyl-ACP methyl ester carboxylesterase
LKSYKIEPIAVEPVEVSISDGRFIVDVYGDAKNHPIVFLCGWGMSTEIYHDRLVELAKNFYIYSISLPGFGKSMPLSIKETSVVGHAKLITEALKEVSLQGKVTLMGHSTGGGVAVFIAKANPELVSEVVMITPVGSPDPLYLSLQRIISKADKGDVDDVIKDKGLFKNWAHNIKLAFDAKRIDLKKDIEQLVKLGVPVHMFLSREDTVTPPGELGEAVDAAAYWVNGGHMWMKRNPSEFINLINAILGKHVLNDAEPKASFGVRFKKGFVRLFKGLKPSRFL